MTPLAAEPLSRGQLFDLRFSPRRLDEIPFREIIPLGHQGSHGDEDEKDAQGIGHSGVRAHLAGKFYVGLDDQIGGLLGDDHGHAEVFYGRHEREDSPGKDGREDQRQRNGPKCAERARSQMQPASSMDSSTALKPERVIRKT